MSRNYTTLGHGRKPGCGQASALPDLLAMYLLGSVLFWATHGSFLTPAYAQARPTLTSLPVEVTQDSVRFANGDKLTGTVKAISDGKLSFTLNLADETTEFPMQNLSQLDFSGPPHPPPERSDVIYLRNGSYLSASVNSLNEDIVEAVTAYGQAIALPKEKVAGIGFYRPEDILFQNDFSSSDKTGLTPVLGSWVAEKGRLVQESPIAFCRAYVHIVQAGAMRYEWTLDLTSSIVGGICFYASRPDARFGSSSYMVTIRRRQAYFYKIIGGARHQAGREQIRASESLVRFKVEYDPRTGDILLWARGDLLMRLNDARPLKHGECVLLNTEGRAVFDDLKVTHLVGGTEGISPISSLDTVLLSNGDRVSGEVLAISQEIVLNNSYTASETSIPREKVRSIVLASPGQNAGPERPAPLPEIAFWNGDVISGHLIAMDDQTATLVTSFVPEIIVARSNLRAITFPQDNSPLPEPEEHLYSPLTVGYGHEATFTVIEDLFIQEEVEEEIVEGDRG